MKLVNIRNDDITDGNPKLTLGLIWTIILHFQVSQLFLWCLFVQLKMFEGCPPCLFLTRWNYEDMPVIRYWNCFVLVSFCCMASIFVQCFRSLDLNCFHFTVHSLTTRGQTCICSRMCRYSVKWDKCTVCCIYFSLWLWYTTNIALFGCCISADTYSVYMLAWEGKHAVIV